MSNKMTCILKNALGRKIFQSSIAPLLFQVGSSFRFGSIINLTSWTRHVSSGQPVPVVGGIQGLTPDLRSADLKGRDIITFDNLTTKDIKTLLWIALDLKASQVWAEFRNSEQADTAQDLCDGKSIFCIYEDPMTKLAISNAARRIGAVPVSVPDVDIDPNMDLEFFGRCVSSSSDMILVESRKWSEQKLEKLSVGSIVPVINLRSTMLAPATALAECMSLQEHYEYLRRLTVSYIGPSTNSMLNTYPTILPKLGIHFRCLMDRNGKINEDSWDNGLKLAQQYNTELHQYDNLPDAIYRTHVISTCYNETDKLLLTMKEIQEADLNWTLFHQEIFKKSTVSTDMLASKQSLVWKTVQNLSWIIQACIVGGTLSYESKLRRPVFEGIP